MILDQLLVRLLELLPIALGAIVVLVIGWLVALILAGAVRRGVSRTNFGTKLATWLKGTEESEPNEAASWAGRVTYYLVMFFVLVAFFQVLGLTFIAEPLRGFLNQIFEYLPRVLAGGALLLLAWIIATVLKVALTRILETAKVDERLGETADIEVEERTSIVSLLANTVYWLVFLFFLPAVLNALALEGLLVPVQDMFVVILGFLPNILAAAIILLLGWFGARILQRLATKLANALGIDRVTDVAGVANVLGEQRLSGLVGILVYAFVMIFAIIAALNALALEAITAPASNMLGMILAALPAILGAVLILVIAYLVGKILAGLATTVLAAAGFDNVLKRLGLSDASLEGTSSPSQMVGVIVLTAVMLFAGIEAASLLGFGLVADLLAQITVILGQIAVGIVIFGIGLYLAGLAYRAILASGGAQAHLLGQIARVAILLLVGAMALSQVGIAPEIVTIGFAIVLATVALTVIIAFGIGGRDLAAKELECWVNKTRSDE